MRVIGALRHKERLRVIGALRYKERLAFAIALPRGARGRGLTLVGRVAPLDEEDLAERALAERLL